MPNFQYTVAGQDGNPATYTDQDIIGELQNQGENVLGLSPDGQQVTLGDDKGQFQVGLDDILQKNGYQIQGRQPLNVNYSNVSPEMRFAVQTQHDDNDRMAILTSKLMRQGYQQPQIVGSGHDWYAFDPKQNQWNALTNQPGLGVSDLVQGGVEAVRGLGMGLGAAGGAFLGTGAGPVGTIGGGMAGGALGAAGADVALQGLAQLDPDVRENTNAGTFFKGAAQEAPIGMIGGALPEVAGAVAPAAKNLIRQGIASTAGRIAGGTASAAGSLVEPIASAVGNSPMLAEFAAGAAPGLGGPVQGGALMQLGKQAITGLPNVGAKLAESGPGRFFLGDEEGTAMAARLRGLTTSPPAIPNGSVIDRINAKLMGTSEEASAEGTMKNIADQMFKPKPAETFGPQELAEGPMPDIMGPQQQLTGIPQSLTTEEGLARQAAARNLMGNVGRFADKAAQIGQGITNTGVGLTQGAAKLAEKGAMGAQVGGRMLNQAAKLTQPFENQGYAAAYLRHLQDKAQSEEEIAQRNRLNRFRSTPKIMSSN